MTLRNLPLAGAAAVVGAVPAIVWNLQNDWSSLDSPIENTTSYQHRLRIFVSPLLPMLLGLRTPFTQEPLLSGVLVLLVLAVLAGLFVYGASRTPQRPASLLYVVAGSYPVPLRARAADDLQPGAEIPPRPEPRRRAASRAARHELPARDRSPRPPARRVDRDRGTNGDVPEHGAVASARGAARPGAARRDLDRAGIDRVYADFWLSYRLTFETDERIVAAQSKLERVGLVGGRALAARHPSIRHRPYERTVEASRHAFVYFRSSLETGADRTPGPEADARVDQLRTFVSKLEGYGYRRVAVESFVVYLPPP